MYIINRIVQSGYPGHFWVRPINSTGKAIHGFTAPRTAFISINSHYYTSTMPSTTTNDGCEIWYECHGSQGHTLVFVSGYMGIANLWEPLIAELGNKYRCIAYDSRGYGRSSKPESVDYYSVPRHADDLAAVFGALQIKEPVTLVAHSMGGNIASTFHLRHSYFVSGIIYSGTYFDGKLATELGTRPETYAGMADSPSRAADFYVDMGLSFDIAIEAAKWPAYARWNNAKALLEHGMGNGFEKISVPTLIVHGELDHATPYEVVVRPMAEALQNSKVVVLKGVKHFPQNEATVEFARLVREFIPSTA